MGKKEIKHIIIIAGETSGDIHAANLVRSIKQLYPSVSFSGLGGPRMRKAGVNIYYDMTQIAVVGFIEIIRHIIEFKKIFNLILKKIKEERPSAVILVDYPGFNIRLAKQIKKISACKIIYYISPQVWAWKKKRIYLLKKYTDKILVFFQFEKELYSKFGIDVNFIGHPLLDSVKINKTREEILSSLKLYTDRITIGILPGSRKKEISRHLPIMLQAAHILNKQFHNLQFIIIKAESITKDEIDKHLSDYTHSEKPFILKIAKKDRYNVINSCDACIVASGTATLETAIVQKPMVIIYKTSFITWIIAKLLIKIPNIGMVNIVAGKRIVPECVQFSATGRKIAEAIIPYITNKTIISQTKKELKKVKALLGKGGASINAAKIVVKIIKEYSDN